MLKLAAAENKISRVGVGLIKSTTTKKRSCPIIAIKANLPIG